MVPGIICMLILLYALTLTPLLSLTLSSSFFVRIVIAIAVIGFPAVFMGMPFPMGLKMLDGISKSLVPWAWGINGCVSVISAALAAIIALEMGFSAVLLFGALAYGMALLSVLKVEKST